jgi:hypothetical protein
VNRGRITDFEDLGELVCVDRYEDRTFFHIRVYQAQWISSIQDVERILKILRSFPVLRLNGSENFLVGSAEELHIQHKIAVKDFPPCERSMLSRWTGFNVLCCLRSSLEITHVQITAKVVNLVGGVAHVFNDDEV